MDINTIFYFPNSLTFEEYTEMLAGGDIAPRTIVFADAQKSIYKDGKKYGDISEQKFRDLLDAVENDSWISDELDGVKGDIITNRNALSNLDNLINQSIQDVQSDITRNRDALNNLNNSIDQSIQGIQSDITDANQRISSLNDSISTVNSNLNTAISNRDAAIQTKIENLFDNAEWLSENFPQGQTSWDSRWDSNLESYLLTVGYWDVDDQTGEKTTKWSQLQSSVDSISSSVNDLKTNGNLTQAMTSSIESLISNDIASLSLGTTYATIASVDDVEKIVEWFYSGITSSSQADKTVAQMSAMSKNDFIAAISDIRTQVDKVANGDFVAQTEVSSKVGDTIANMLLQSSSDNALAALSAKANANSDNISALILGMTGSTSTANLATSVSTALTNLTAGLATTSDVNSAKSEIYSAIGAKDGNGNFISLAAVKTQTDKVANGDFVAQTEVQSKVGDAVSTMLAQASTDNALAALSAKADTNSDNISALILGMTGSTSTANLSTNVSNALNNLTSGLISTTDANTAIGNAVATAKTDVYSAIGAKDSSDNFITLSSLKVQTDKLANGDYVAEADLSTKVGTAVSNMLLQSSTDNSLAALSAKADTNSDNISALILGMTGSTSTANLSTSVSTALNNLTSGLASSSDITSAKSEIYSAISAKDSSDNFISLAALKTQSDADHAQVQALASNGVDTSGFVAKSELGSSVASLFASTGDALNPTAKANVVAVVKDNKSALNLTAQDVNIDGYLTAGNASFKGSVEATSFTTGSSSEYGITVLSGGFDPTAPDVNTHKAYFAYDSEQGGVTMWFYCDNAWKRIDLAAASINEDPDAFDDSILYTGTVFGTYLLSDSTYIHTYYNRVKAKTYSTTNAVDANLLTVTGYRFDNGWDPVQVTENSFGIKDPTVAYDGNIAFYVPNVTSNLNLGQKPLYLFKPSYIISAFQNAIFQPHSPNDIPMLVYKYTYLNGQMTPPTKVPLSYVCDTVSWHASGDPLPDGIIAQNSQTPSTNDAFAYATWKIGDYSTIMTNASSGDEFCIAGGNGNVYKTAANGKQIVLQVSALSNWESNSSREATSAMYTTLSSEGGNNNGYYQMLNIQGYNRTGNPNPIPSNLVTQVGHIWHCVPSVPYTYPDIDHLPSNS